MISLTEIVGKIYLPFIVLSLIFMHRNAWLHVIHSVSNYPLPIGYDSSAITLTDIQHSHWLTQLHLQMLLLQLHLKRNQRNALIGPILTRFFPLARWLNKGNGIIETKLWEECLSMPSLVTLIIICKPKN